LSLNQSEPFHNAFVVKFRPFASEPCLAFAMTPIVSSVALAQSEVDMCSFDCGDVVPIPTLPRESTRRLVAVLEPTTNAGSPAAELIESLAQGDDDARPTLPVKLFVLENVLKSASSVDEAEVPLEVSIHTWPDDVVFRIPAVDVDTVMFPTTRFVVDAVTNDEYAVDDEYGNVVSPEFVTENTFEEEPSSLNKFEAVEEDIKKAVFAELSVLVDTPNPILPDGNTTNCGNFVVPLK
jgi:hypothetical protein